MGSTELAANLFRATQTKEKIENDKVTDKNLANDTHYIVGTKVRKAIKDIGGVMPEELPKPEKSINQIQKEQQEINEKKKLSLSNNN